MRAHHVCLGGPVGLAHGESLCTRVSSCEQADNRAGRNGESSGAEGFHLRALPELDVSLSTHPASIVQPRPQVANAEAELAAAT